jgi:hypothetical protein
MSYEKNNVPCWPSTPYSECAACGDHYDNETFISSLNPPITPTEDYPKPIGYDVDPHPVGLHHKWFPTLSITDNIFSMDFYSKFWTVGTWMFGSGRHIDGDGCFKLPMFSRSNQRTEEVHANQSMFVNDSDMDAALLLPAFAKPKRSANCNNFKGDEKKSNREQYRNVSNLYLFYRSSPMYCYIGEVGTAPIKLFVITHCCNASTFLAK